MQVQKSEPLMVGVAETARTFQITYLTNNNQNIETKQSKEGDLVVLWLAFGSLCWLLRDLKMKVEVT